MSDGNDNLALVVRVAEGDESALAELYDRLAPRVLGLLCRMISDRAIAEEVLQDAFWEVWKRAQDYRPDASAVQTWVVMIARSRAIDRLRKERRRVGDVALDAAPETVSPEHEAQIVTDETTRTLGVACQRLSPEQAQAIRLAFYSGFTHVEIAEQLGVPLGTIKSRIRSGVERLRQTPQLQRQFTAS